MNLTRKTVCEFNQFVPRVMGGIAIVFLGFVALSGCSDEKNYYYSDGDGGLTPSESEAPPAPKVELEYDIKTFKFSWAQAGNADFYRLFENPDGLSGFTQVGGDLSETMLEYDHVVPLYARLNAAYFLRACNDAGCSDSNYLFPGKQLEQAIGYVKSSNTAQDDFLGESVALSADGNTLAVGAPNKNTGSGAAYIFVRSDDTWEQQDYLQLSFVSGGEQFGRRVALSADGNTLVVSAMGDNSAATGINGDDRDISAAESGAAYVYKRIGATWSRQAYIKASNTEAGDAFGTSIALSSDGNTLAVGAAFEDSVSIGVDGDESDNTASASGAVYLFTRSGDIWNQLAYIKASNTEQYDLFGLEISLSADGNTLAVSGFEEDSSATGVNGDQADNSASQSGAVYVFVRSGDRWDQHAYLKASNTGESDQFGSSVALAADGSTLVVGARQEDSAATGIDGNQNDNSASTSGAVYVFTRSEATWNQQAYVKASNTHWGYFFGGSVALSGDGNTLVVGSDGEDSPATGIDGSQAEDLTKFSIDSKGAVYVFLRDSGVWRQQAYVKATNTDVNDYFGRSVVLSADSNTLAVGAPGESSAATGVNGDQADNSANKSGAVYLY